MSRRRSARELALQMLYQIDVNPDADPRDVRSQMEGWLTDESLQQFAWQLFTGVRERRQLIDEQIETAAENWTLSRMAPTDRNVLRLGTYELLYSETPHRVVIDEAIEIAKRFGSKQSSQFVNGILDRLIPESKRTKSDAPDPQTED